jgi:hypothetical protein
MSAPVTLAFPHAWHAEILRERPAILPSRHFTYPHDAEEIERGALEVLIRHESDVPFLATFALGFADPVVPTGLWSCPAASDLCAVAGGYAYIVNTHEPERCTQIELRPVLQIEPLRTHNLLLFAGSYALVAWGSSGVAWRTARLSSEGLRITEIRGDTLRGFGWDLMADREVPFTVDLRNGQRVDESEKADV